MSKKIKNPSNSLIYTLHTNLHNLKISFSISYMDWTKPNLDPPTSWKHNLVWNFLYSVSLFCRIEQ